jgi:Domain of Unknown Function (DUF1080)
MSTEPAILKRLPIYWRSDTGATAVAITHRRYQPRRADTESPGTTRSVGRGRTAAWLGLGAACAVLLLAGLTGSAQLPTSERFEGVLLTEDFDTLTPGERWRDGEQHGQWQVEYAGYGTTAVLVEGGRHLLSMSPRVAEDAGTTHGGLVTTLAQFENIDVTAQLRTERQLRRQAPNPWEVAWFVWHYTDDHHFYSVVLKPNGWELGKEDPAYPGSQRYLATGSTPSFPVGVQHTVRVQHVGNEISVWANGNLLTTYRDTERPYRVGRIGLYTEDAHVHFDSVVVRRP